MIREFALSEFRKSVKGAKNGDANAALAKEFEQICEALKELDIVKFSLDSAVQKTFARIDRSSEKIDIDELVGAMAKFRREFKGELVLEILVVKGLNDTRAEFEALNAALNQILPARVDIKHHRPPTRISG